MKIWQKLTTAFGVTSFLLGTISILAIKIDAEVQSKTNETVYGIIEEAKSASKILKSIQTIQELNQDFFVENLRSLPEDDRFLEEYKLKVESALEKLEESIKLGEEATLNQTTIIKYSKGKELTDREIKIDKEREEIVKINFLLAEVQAYRKDWKLFIDNIERGSENFPFNSAKKLINRMNKEILPLVNEYYEESLSEITRAELIAQNITSNNITTIKNYVLFTFVLSPILFIYIYRSIYSPIKHLKLATYQLGQNVSEYEPIEPENPNDELGKFIAYFNETIETLKTKIISKSYLDNIIDSISQSLIVIDLENKIEKINSNTIEFLGYSESELIGQNINYILSPSNNLTIDELIKLDNLSSRCFSLNLITKKSEEISFKVYFSYLIDPEGEQKGTICLAMPIQNLALDEIINLQRSKEKAKKSVKQNWADLD